MCERGAAVDVADRVEPVLEPFESSTSIGSPGSRPSGSTPMSSVLGRRPVATSSSSPRLGPPRSIRPRALPPRGGRPPPQAEVHVHPVLPQGILTCWPANGSSRARTERSSGSISVTWDPERRVCLRHLDPDHAAPEHDQASGRPLRRRHLAVGPRQGDRRGPSTLVRQRRRTAGRDDHRPAGTGSATRRRSAPRRSPSIWPRPRTSAMPLVPQPRHLAPRRQARGRSRRGGRGQRAHVEPAGHRRACALDPPRLCDGPWAGRSSAFDGMQA